MEALGVTRRASQRTVPTRSPHAASGGENDPNFWCLNHRAPGGLILAIRGLNPCELCTMCALIYFG